MPNKATVKFLSADTFMKSTAVERNLDISFREIVARFFRVSHEEIIRIRRAKDASGWATLIISSTICIIGLVAGDLSNKKR